MSVRLSVLKHGTNGFPQDEFFEDVLYLKIFLNLSRKFKFH